MPTVETKIWLALRARAQQLVALTGLPMSWPNENFSAPSTGYLQVNDSPNVPIRTFLGSTAPHERMGVFQIMVKARQNQNSAVAKEIAGIVAAHFPPDLPMRYDGITVNVMRAPFVGGVVATDAFAEVAVNIQYRCFA